MKRAKHSQRQVARLLRNRNSFRGWIRRHPEQWAVERAKWVDLRHRLERTIASLT